MALVILGALVLLFALLALYFYLTQPPHIVGLDPRRPGYMAISPDASASENRTTVTTLPRTATSTGCKTDGPRPAEVGSLATRRALSRTTAHTASGSDTATGPGGPTTVADLEPLRSTAWMIRRVHRDPSRIVERGWSTPVLHAVEHGDAA